MKLPALQIDVMMGEFLNKDILGRGRDTECLKSMCVAGYLSGINTSRKEASGACVGLIR